MSDARGWHAPEEGEGTERPRYGEHAPPPPPPLPGQPSSDASPQQRSPGGWAPPPKPGLVPLRPLGFGTLLGAPFSVLRHSRAIVGLAVALQVGVFLVGSGLIVAAVLGGIGRVTDFEDPDQQPLIAGGIAAMIITTLVLVVMSLAVSAVLQGFVVVDVARGVLGRRTRLAELWRVVRGRVPVLAAWTLVLFLGMAVEVAIVAGIIVFAATSGIVGLAVGIPVALLVGLGFVVLTVWVTVKLSLLPSALVLERLPLGAALRRSWTLTRGYFWRTFGVQALLTVIISIVSQVIALPLSLLPLLGVVVDPSGTGAALWISIVASLLSIVVSLVVGAISAVVLAAAIALIYLDLRMRKEGLDLVLQRYVEEPDTTPDPFAPGVV